MWGTAGIGPGKRGARGPRAGQAGELAAFVAKEKKPAVLCGDFNCEYPTPPLASLRGMGCRDLVAGTPDAEKPSWDNTNPYIQSPPEKFPDRRIDLVLANEDFLKARPLKKAVIDFKKADKKGLFLSDHWGIVADFV